MKQVIFVLLLFTCSEAIAQTLYVGPAVSTRFAKPVFDNSAVKESNVGQWAPGFSGGISATMMASKLFGLTTEVLYHYQQKDVQGTDDFSYVREKLHYIKIPALFQYSHRINQYRAYGVVGPVVNYWIGGKGKALVPELVEGDLENGLTYTIVYEGVPTEEQFYVSDPNRLQLGVQIGAGVAIPMQRNFLKVDARFEWGHTNLAKENSTYSPFAFYDISLDHTFHSVSITCAYVFTFDLFEMTHKGKNSKKK
ncbi:MAG: outer membrane beta-barrel protein [Cyclobacteriaceae bacterium]